jgi:CRISPR-associated exonuclease Cas4
MGLVALGVSLVLLLLALWLAQQARAGRRRSGLPGGRMVYADTGDWAAVSKPLYSARYRLTGKPDYLVDTPSGLVPVEVKGTVAPGDGQAYGSHVMQLAAYCLLVEEVHGQRPPYGLIRYADATIAVDYGWAIRKQLLDLVGEIRHSRRRRQVRRSHQEPARCRACGLRHACGGQALVR